MNEQVTLELATDEQVVDELKRRYRCVLLVTEADDSKDFYTEFSYSGGVNAAIGMAFRAIEKLKKGEEEEEEEGPD